MDELHCCCRQKFTNTHAPIATTNPRWWQTYGRTTLFQKREEKLQEKVHSICLSKCKGYARLKQQFFEPSKFNQTEMHLKMPASHHQDINSSSATVTKPTKCCRRLDIVLAYLIWQDSVVISNMSSPVTFNRPLSTSTSPPGFGCLTKGSIISLSKNRYRDRCQVHTDFCVPWQ